MPCPLADNVGNTMWECAANTPLNLVRLKSAAQKPTKQSDTSRRWVR
jgi:hypothetical protein